jgi:hypothetical protein
MRARSRVAESAANMDDGLVELTSNFVICLAGVAQLPDRVDNLRA